SSRRRHTRFKCDWSSDVCSSDLMTTIALAFGLVLALVFGPGHGMDIDVAKLDAKQLASFADNAHKLQGGGFGGFILNIIPPTARSEERRVGKACRTGGCTSSNRE